MIVRWLPVVQYLPVNISYWEEDCRRSFFPKFISCCRLLRISQIGNAYIKLALEWEKDCIGVANTLLVSV